MELRLFKLAVLLSLVCFTGTALAGTVTRPTKTFGGSSFINGVVPQASDFNGDTDTIYSEFNGNIDNANIKVAAAISASKINADGFTVNVRTTNVAPCNYLDETDQASDLKRWASCINGGVYQLGTYSDVNALQNNWLTITRANGGFTFGGTSGTNIINGATTFNQLVTFTGGTSLTPTGMVTMFMGTSSPTGWLLMDGASSSCTGASSVNASLCTQLISLFASVNYKGSGTTITTDFTSDEILHTAHGHIANDRVHFSTTTTLPAPLVATTVYCIISVTTDRYKVSDTCGGAVVDLTTNGTGTQTDYFNFLVPDARGRTPVGTGAGAGLTARVIGATGGVETLTLPTITDSHVLSIPEMPSHTHVERYTSGASTAGLGIGSAGFINSSSSALSTDATGGGGGHTHTISGGGAQATMNPFLVMSYIIKL